MTDLTTAVTTVQSDLDCRKCGACCMTAGEVPVGLGENVPRYLTRSVRNMMGFASWEADDIRRMARTQAGVCAALKGTVGADCRCGIYARRPDVCREFLPGKPDCLEARRQAGLK